MTLWDLIGMACAAFLGAYFGTMIAAPRPRRAKPAQRFPIDLDTDAKHRGATDQPASTRPTEGDL